MLAGEVAAGLVRVDDYRGVGKGVGRQVMIGDKHIDTASLCLGHTVNAGDTVIHRHDDVRRFGLCGECDDFRGQAVTVFEAVGYDVIDTRTQGAQAADRDRASSSAIAIIVGDDHHFFSCFDGISEKYCCLINMQQSRRRNECIQRCR